MRKVLIAVDFSDASLHAALMAAKISNQFPLELHLLNVYHLPNPLQTLPIELIVTTEELGKASDSKLQQLKELVAKEMQHPERISIHSENGNTYQGILHFAGYVHADLIMVGMKQNGFVKDRILGSTVDPLIRSSHLPVLVIPEKASVERIKNILFLTDGQAITGMNGIELIQEWQKFTAFKLAIVRLSQHREPVEKEEIMEKLDVQLKDIPHTYSFPETEHLETSVHAIVADSKADMIVLQAHHHGLTGQLLGLDHAKNITHGATVPVLILPATTN